MKKIYITWQEFEEMVNLLTVDIKNENLKLKNIYGIPRGGLPIAVYLSHKLDLPLITDVEKINFDTLIVDDISDNGTQLEPFYKDYCIVTLHSTEWTLSPPNFHAMLKLDKDDWIVYPWEKSNDNNM